MIKIPTFKCREGCADCCGIVPFSEKEKAAATARMPLVRWEEIPKFSGVWFPVETIATHRCAFVKDGQCSIYEDRPMICRLFGAVDNKLMKCPHGCRPRRLISDAAARKMLAANPH